MWRVSSCYPNHTQRLAVLALHNSAGRKSISHQESEKWHPVSLFFTCSHKHLLSHTYTDIELSMCYLWEQTEDINGDREGSESVNEVLWLLRRKALSKLFRDKYLLFLCIYQKDAFELGYDCATSWKEFSQESSSWTIERESKKVKQPSWGVLFFKTYNEVRCE